MTDGKAQNAGVATDRLDALVSELLEKGEIECVSWTIIGEIQPFWFNCCAGCCLEELKTIKDVKLKIGDNVDEWFDRTFR